MADKVKVQELDAESQELVTSLFKGNPEGAARFGEGGYTIPKVYKKYVDDIKNMPVRPDDTWVVTFPRSGTTWTQDLVWLLMNNFDYETALKTPLIVRYSFIEAYPSKPLDRFKPGELDPVTIQNLLKMFPPLQSILDAPSPRFIKTHIPFSLLPDNILDVSKVVYVARDPRDVAVSFYHHSRLLKEADYVGDFKTYWGLFMKNLVMFCPFFSHLKEAWAQRHHPNLLFIFYEDLSKDLPGSIRRIAKFLGKEVSSEQTQKLCEHLDIKNFRNNESVNPKWLTETGNAGEEGFIRQGKCGGWREYFDEGMAAQAQAWIRVNLADTDLRFPDATS